MPERDKSISSLLVLSLCTFIDKRITTNIDEHKHLKEDSLKFLPKRRSISL